MLPTTSSRVQSVALTAASIYVSAWGIYYIAQEAIRRSTLRSRKRKYPLQAPLLPPQTLSAGARVADRVGVLGRTSPKYSPKEERDFGAQSLIHPDAPSHRPPNWYGHATDYELAKIHKRFASMRILGRWANVVPEWREQGAWEWVFWKGFYALFYKPRIWWDGGLAKDIKTLQGREKIEKLLPVQKMDWKKLWGQQRDKVPAPEHQGATFTWIGQSTCLIQMHGLTILTDPVFGKQPLESFMSPNRMRPMPCSFNDLVREGRIDAILLTHNHFDHLDVSILPQVPRSTKWIVPLGLTPLLVKYGLDASQITELDWWKQGELSFDLPVRAQGGTIEKKRRRLDVTAVPATHWSARTPLDTNTTLWNSYAVRVHVENEPIHKKPASLFFCGDTGYSPSLFTAIGRALGPFDFAALPIGSYEPRWHMQIQHMHVTESVQVAKDVGARRSFAMHWGTWQMSDERWDDPPQQLEKELTKRGEPSECLLCVPFGKTLDVAVGGEA